MLGTLGCRAVLWCSFFRHDLRDERLRGGKNMGLLKECSVTCLQCSVLVHASVSHVSDDSTNSRGFPVFNGFLTCCVEYVDESWFNQERLSDLIAPY